MSQTPAQSRAAMSAEPVVAAQTRSRRWDTEWLLRAAGAVLTAAAVAGLLVIVWLNLRLLDQVPAKANSVRDMWSSTVGAVVLIGCAGVVTLRYPRNLVGWLLLGFTVFAMVDGVAEELGLAAFFLAGAHVGDGGMWGSLSEAAQRAEFGFVFLLVLVFPTGRPLTRRWGVLGWVTAMVFGAWFLVHLLSTAPLDEDPFRGRVNPWGLRPFGNTVLQHGFLPVAAVLGLVCVASMIVRFRRSSGVERQQLKWVGFAAGAVPINVAAVAVASLFGSAAMEVVGNGLAVLLYLLLPVTVAVSITRYRLYDLDLLVNRTVVYGLLSLALFAIYAAVVLTATRLTVGAGWTSPAVVAIATLAAAVVAAPARTRIQRTVDRLFARRTWTAQRRIERFAAASRDDPQPPNALRGVLAATCGDPSLEVGYWLRDRRTYTREDGTPLDPDAEPSAAMRPVDLHGEPMALVAYDPRAVRDARLLDRVLDASALLLENARLRAEVLAQLADVTASRARIVHAADQERRRVERDLHDGAQQRLAGLALQLSLAARQANAPHAAFLTELRAEVQAALADLRDLARGIHPSALEDGLAAALETATARLPVDVTLDIPDLPLPAATALTAYYVASEAITNAVKHAHTPTVHVRGRRHGDNLILQIVDHGSGGAHATAGSGLAGLADRVSAVTGTLHVDSPDGAGTTITVELPCGS